MMPKAESTSSFLFLLFMFMLYTASCFERVKICDLIHSSLISLSNFIAIGALIL